MVWLRRTLLALAIGTAMISRAASAQHGTASLIHTVSVTVPPRMKVQVGALSSSGAMAFKVGSVNSSTQGLSLNISATESWVLSVGTNASSAIGSSPMRWSLESGSGFSTLTETQVNVASGAVSTEPTAATVFFRGGTAMARDNAAPIVLTITAP